MPNLNDLSNFAKREDLVEDSLITFKNAGEIKDVDFSKAKDGSGIKKVFQIDIELLDGKIKSLTMNATSKNLLKEAYGVHTESWIGKQATVVYVKQLCFGKMTDVLVLTPVEE